MRLECILYNVLGKKWVDYISSAHIQRSMTSENDIPVHFDVIIRQVREWIYNYVLFEFGTFITVSENVRKIIVQSHSRKR